MNEQRQTVCKSEGFSVGFCFVLFVLISSFVLLAAVAVCFVRFIADGGICK